MNKKQKYLLTVASGLIIILAAFFVYFWLYKGLIPLFPKKSTPNNQVVTNDNIGSKNSASEGALSVEEVKAVSGPGQIIISWMAPPTQEKVVNYEIKYSTSSDFSGAEETVSNDLTATIANLNGGVTYFIVVRAVLEGGYTSSWSQPISVVPQAPKTYDLFSAVDVVGNNADFVWQLIGTNISPVSYIEVIWSSSSSFSTILGRSNVSVGGVSGRYNIQGLTGGANYYLRARAVEKNGTTDAWRGTNIFSLPPAPQAVATDTAAPTRVEGLVLTSGEGVVHLRWAAATDNVGIAGYEYGFADIPQYQPSENTFADVTGILGTSVSRPGLINGLAYSFWVRAYDAAGNRGPWSLSQTATPELAVDTESPSSVTGVVVSAGNSSVVISEYSATDNVEVDHYALWWSTTNAVPNGEPNIATITTESYQVIGLTNDITYYFWMTAVDGAGNESGAKSSFVSATPLASYPDTTPPSQVTGLVITPGNGRLTLSDYTATDNVGIVTYEIYYGDPASPNLGTPDANTVATIPGLAYSQSTLSIVSLPNDVTYYYWMRAVDGAGNKGTWSVMVPGTPLSSIDATNPSTVTGVVATPGDGLVVLSGYTATDNVGVVSYSIYYNTTGIPSGAPVFTGVTESSFEVTGLTNGVTYYFWMKASDAMGNRSVDRSTVVTAEPAIIDLEAPSQVTGLTATHGDANVTLVWDEASDNVAVADYSIEYSSSGDFSNPSFATSSNNGVTISSLTNGVQYYFRVKASDAANNEGEWSTLATATPQEPADVTSPSQVTGVVANAGDTIVTLSGYTATDNIGVDHYRIWYNTTGVEPTGTADISLVTSATYEVQGLTNGTPYYFWIMAVDAADNVSLSKSTVVTATPAGSGIQQQTIAFSAVPNTIINSASADGTAWSGQGATTFKTNGMDAVWDGTSWYAGGFNSGDAAYSSVNTSVDGINWTPISTPMITGNVTGVTYGVVNGTPTYVAVGSSPGTGSGSVNLMYKQGSGEWTAVESSTSIFSILGNRVAWNGSKFIAVGRGTNTIAWSSDGVSWTGLGQATFANYGYDIAWNGSYWLAAGTGGTGSATLAWSADGLTWNPIDMATSFTNGNGLAWSDENNTWVAVGSGGTGLQTISYCVDTHHDPENYPLVFTPVPDSKTTIFTTSGKDVTWDGSRFVAVGIGTNGMAISDDGITWTGLGTTVVASGRGVVSNKEPYTGAYWNNPVGVKGAMNNELNLKLILMWISGFIAFMLSIFLFVMVYRRRNR